MASASPSIADHFADEQQQHAAGTFGMWLFLLTEVMLFGALFTSYAVYRYLHPHEFAAGSGHLDIWLGTANTVVLIGSSLTMALAHHAAQDSRRRKQLFGLLVATILLGCVFLGVKTFEYAGKIEEQLLPGPYFQWEYSVENAFSDAAAVSEGGDEEAAVELFFSLYFVMTGLHAAHMVIGIALMAILAVMAGRGRVRAIQVETMGLYWHFVDIVWIFLFPLLYLIGRHQ